jgi:hypothetical protein
MPDTLGSLKAEIADDLARSDISVQIASAITRAVRSDWTTRFYFNETRASTFPTVPGQTLYGSAALADIPNFFEIDDVFLTDSSGHEWKLDRRDAGDLEVLTSTGGSRGDPTDWAWIAQQIMLHPIPNAVRTIRIVGAIKIDAPTVDSDSTSVWVNDGYELVRRHAKALLFAHTIRDVDGSQLQFQMQATEAERQRLIEETSRKRATGTITPTQF